MNYFQKKIGAHNAIANFYLHQPSEEIDPQRKYPVMVVVPGGGYLWTSDRESEPVAFEFLARGYHAVVVEYSTEGREAYANQLPDHPVSLFPNPVVELAETIALLREEADSWAVDTASITVLGFSAGGNLAALLGVYWQEEWLENLVQKKKELYRPNHLALAYAVLDFGATVHKGEASPISYALLGELSPTDENFNRVSPSQLVNDSTPPSFIWHTTEDSLVPVSNALTFAVAMNEKKRPYELHIYEKGTHGLSLADKRTGRKENQLNRHAASWIDLLVDWLDTRV